ncbi:hypothetical protein G6F68_013319 [Rhizopus microsporus]|nr:hypothetical protein G6F68_013319 [Rhizopus microsporus]
MGFGNTPIIVVVALSAFFPAALSVMNATESVQRVHVSAARVMGATRWGLVKRVYLPAVMPELIPGAQLAFGNAWRALISAEMLIGFGKGLGRSLAYTVIVLCGVSTLFMNGNPLLRYDGYYVLSDAIEIPNLGQRSNGYLGYLFKRYALGLRGVEAPRATPGERAWFVGSFSSACCWRCGRCSTRS